MDASSRFPRARASVLIGYLRWLEVNGYHERVASLVTPDVRAIMREPPLRTSWIDARDLERILDAFGRVAAPGEARRLGRQTTEETILPALRPILEATLRRMASPSMLYRRLDVMLKAIVPEQSARYRETAPDGAEITIEYPYVPVEATLEVWAGALEVALALCGTVGTIELVSRGERGRAATFAARWR